MARCPTRMLPRLTLEDFLENTTRVNECMEWNDCKNSTSYARYSHSKSPFRTKTVSRIILEFKLGRPIKEKFIACHTCDNPPCINPDHLWEGTHEENIRDCHAKGRASKSNAHIGEERKTSKLTDLQVVEIFRLRVVEKKTTVEIGTLLEINSSQISAVLNRKIWKHVQIPEEYLGSNSKALQVRAKVARYVSEEAVAKVLSLKGTGTYKEIALVVGCSRSSARRILKGLGIYAA